MYRVLDLYYPFYVFCLSFRVFIFNSIRISNYLNHIMAYPIPNTEISGQVVRLKAKLQGRWVNLGILGVKLGGLQANLDGPRANLGSLGPQRSVFG